MKKIVKSISIVLAFIGVFTIFACSDEEDTKPESKTETANACNGGDGFCMNYGGVEKSGEAKLTVQSRNNKIRVYWENGAAASYEQLELDVYSLSVGTFQVNDLAIANSSAFVQYFSTSGGVVNPAYGTVTITALDTLNGVTGSFNVTMKDSTKITDGVFKNIVK